MVNVAARAAGACAALLRASATSVVSSTGVNGDRKRQRLANLGESLASSFEDMGGGFLKIGQVLSTRVDLLHPDVLAPFQRLQDAVPALPTETIRVVVERSLGQPIDAVFSSFDSRPIGSATIAQVHRAVLRSSNSPVAIKIRRPGIERLLRTDCRILCAAVSAASILPAFRGIPVSEAVQQVTQSMLDQANLRREAHYQRRAFALFPKGVPVRVPRLVEDYCTDDLLVMDYVAGTKVTDHSVPVEVQRQAVARGLQALYAMLFLDGLVHCDLHPGNILVDDRGNAVVLDFGFGSAMSSTARMAFARFFLTIALNDGRQAAAIILSTARRVSSDFDAVAFEHDMCALVARSSGLRPRDFLVASFVDSLFAIQRRRGVDGSPDFTMAILSLVVYEGLVRHRCPDLDFQGEAVPFVMRALQEHDHSRAPAVDSFSDQHS